MDYKKNINRLKVYFNAENNKELALKMGISEATIKSWATKKEIPEKYAKYAKSITKQESNNNKISNGNIIQGHINTINITNGYSHKVCEEIQKLDEKQQEYFYNLIRAEVIKKEMNN